MQIQGDGFTLQILEERPDGLVLAQFRGPEKYYAAYRVAPDRLTPVTGPCRSPQKAAKKLGQWLRAQAQRERRRQGELRVLALVQQWLEQQPIGNPPEASRQAGYTAGYGGRALLENPYARREVKTDRRGQRVMRVELFEPADGQQEAHRGWLWGYAEGLRAYHQNHLG